MNLFMTQGDNFKAGICAGLDGLALLGLSIPRQAIATIDRAPQVGSIALSDFTEIPQAVIRTVKRHLEPVMINHAATAPMLANDTYVSRHAVKSLLCAPILRQGQLVALLYLKNRVTVGAFTGDRAPQS